MILKAWFLRGRRFSTFQEDAFSVCRAKLGDPSTEHRAMCYAVMLRRNKGLDTKEVLALEKISSGPGRSLEQDSGDKRSVVRCRVLTGQMGVRE